MDEEDTTEIGNLDESFEIELDEDEDGLYDYRIVYEEESEEWFEEEGEDRTRYN